MSFNRRKVVDKLVNHMFSSVMVIRIEIDYVIVMEN